MADGGTGEKTEEPTPERLRKLREEGNVAKSQDVVPAISFLGVLMVLAGTIPFISKEMTSILRNSIYVAFELLETDPHAISRILADATWSMFKSCIPALGAAFVLG